jgi:tetratricopeptide (TPR) repeat protein
MRAAPAARSTRKGSLDCSAMPAARRAIGGGVGSNGGDGAHSRGRKGSDMAKLSSRAIEDLIQQCEWEAARRKIEHALTLDRNNHWLLTQLGVTYYEQEQYEKSLEYFLRSLAIVPECPLTLWNLAGVRAALGAPKDALRIYAWLLSSNKSAQDDPCWESKDWTDSLKADCVYRAGVCFQQVKQWKLAGLCLRHYINVLLSGIDGTYSVEDAVKRIRELPRTHSPMPLKKLREAVKSVFEGNQVRSVLGPKKLSPQELVPS